MAIIYSYPTMVPSTSDLVLGTDVSANGKPTKNFTVQSIIDLVSVTAQNLTEVLTTGNDAGALNIVNLNNLGSVSITNTGNIATASATATGIVQAETFQTTLGIATWTTTVLAGFTSITTTGITLNGTVGGTALVQVIPAAPATGSTTKIVSEKAIIDYITSNPTSETLAETLANGDVSGGANNINMTGVISNITFVDSGTQAVPVTTQGRALFGAGNDLQIYHDGTNSYIDESGTGGLILKSNLVSIKDPTGLETMATFDDDGSVDLYYDNSKKFETTSTGVTIAGTVTASVGTNALPSYTFAGDTNTGMWHPAVNEINLSVNGGIILNVANTGLTVTGITESDSLTTDTTLLKTPMTRFVKSTDPSDPVTTPATAGISAANLQVDTMVPTVLAVKTYTDSVVQASTLTYQGELNTPSPDLNLSTDIFKIIGGSNIGTQAFAVGTNTANVGEIVIDLDNNVTISGTMQASIFRTAQPATAKWETTILSGFTSITSDLFIGDSTASLLNPIGGAANVQFQGNASTANSLFNTGGLAIVDNVVLWPTVITSNNEVVAANSQTITYSTATPPTPNFPVVGQSVEGGTVVADTKVSSVSADGLTIGLDTVQTAGIAVNTTLTYQTPTLTYTNGGNVNIPTFIPDTVATSKLLTNLPTPVSSAISSSDTILAGMAKLQGQITATSGLTYEGLWNATTDSPALSGTTPANGVFYIVDVAGNTNLSGITDWLVGDWAIYVSNGSATDGWQKLDMTSDITGTGSANSYAMWTGPNSVATGLISQNAAGNLVTIGNGGGLSVEGNSTLGDAIGDTTIVAGPLTASKNIVITEGISLGSGSTLPYGTAGDVLTSGGGIGAANTWTTPTTGTLTGITAGTGITTTLNAAGNNVTVGVDYLGTDNFIEAASATYGNPNTLDTMVYSERNSGAASDNVKKFLIGNLPFNNYSWKLGDGATNTTISNGSVVDFIGSDGINAALINSQDLSIKINYVGANNAILSAGAGTPIATDELLFNNADVASGTVQRASIASIVDLGNETLAQVLTNGNTTGGTKILVNADDASGGGISLVDDAKIRFSTNGHMQLYGTGTENRIYNNGAPLRISVAGGGYSGSVIISKGVGAAAETMAEFNTDGSVDLYYDAVKKFETTSTGVSVTGNLLVSNGTKGNLFLGPQTGTGTGNDSEITSNHSLYIDYAKLTGTSGNFYISNNTTTQLTIQGSTGKVVFNEYGSGTITGTPTYNLEVDSSGNIIETPSTNPGGNGGTFSGSKDIDAGGVIKVFTLTRATTGCLVFDVFFTADFVSGVGGGPPIAEKWTVVHGNSQTPVYNKIISNDGQFGTGGYDVTFADASSGTAVECSVAQRSGSSYPSLSYTIIVGYSENNALTFTPA